MPTTIYISLAHQLWRLEHMLDFYFQHTYTGRIAAAFWELLAELWYFVILGALVSALVWRYLPKHRIRDLLERRTNSSIVVASVLGLISPMCTFAAIPIVGSLIAMRLPAAPLIAFMMASPLMNPALFVYTAGAIGLEMAIARTLTALSIGLAAGFLTRLVQRGGLLHFDDLAVEKVPQPFYPAVAGGSSRTRWMELQILTRRFKEDLFFIAKFFTLGLFVAALIQTFLTREMVLVAVGPGSKWAVPAAVAMGVPLYACGGGTIPVIETMIQMGMTAGAALAFFTAGPATKFSTLAVLVGVFGRRLLAFYLVVMIGGALLWGYSYPFSTQALSIAAERDAQYENLVVE